MCDWYLVSLFYWFGKQLCWMLSDWVVVVVGCCLLGVVRLPVGFMTQAFFCEKFVLRRERMSHPIQWKFNIKSWAIRCVFARRFAVQDSIVAAWVAFAKAPMIRTTSVFHVRCVKILRRVPELVVLRVCPVLFFAGYLTVWLSIVWTTRAPVRRISCRRYGARS